MHVLRMLHRSVIGDAMMLVLGQGDIGGRKGGVLSILCLWSVMRAWLELPSQGKL